MKIKLLSIFLLASCTAYGQHGEVAGDQTPVYVLLAPAGADTGLEIRSAMRIKIVHMPEGKLTGYRHKDQALLAACHDEASAESMMAKLKSTFQYARVEKLHLKSAINEGFNDVKHNTGRADPTFPLYYETGDNMLDARSYRIEKLEWVANHPMDENGPLPGTIKQTN